VMVDRRPMSHTSRAIRNSHQRIAGIPVRMDSL
jgi:hypothetical protein